MEGMKYKKTGKTHPYKADPIFPRVVPNHNRHPLYLLRIYIAHRYIVEIYVEAVNVRSQPDSQKVAKNVDTI